MAKLKRKQLQITAQSSLQASSRNSIWHPTDARKNSLRSEVTGMFYNTLRFAAYLWLFFPFHSGSQVTPVLPTEGSNYNLTVVQVLRGGIWQPDQHLLEEHKTVSMS